jgi:WD40 repeat protein
MTYLKKFLFTSLFVISNYSLGMDTNAITLRINSTRKTTDLSLAAANKQKHGEKRELEDNESEQSIKKFKKEEEEKITIEQLIPIQQLSKDVFGIIASYCGAHGISPKLWAMSLEKKLSLQGHDDSVQSIQFSPDDKQVATGSADTTAKIWDPKTGKLLHDLTMHRGTVNCVNFKPDNTQLVTACSTGYLRVWDCTTGQLVYPIAPKGVEAANTAQFSPCGTRLLTTGTVHGATIYAEKEPLVRLLGHAQEVHAASFSPCAKHIITASEDKTARIHTLSTLHSVVLKGHALAVKWAEMSPCGKYVVTASEDGTARIWSAKKGSLLYGLLGHTDGLCKAHFSPSGQLIFTISEDGTLGIWEGSNIVHVIQQEGAIGAAAINKSYTQVAIAGPGEAASIWEPAFAVNNLTAQQAALIWLCDAYSTKKKTTLKKIAKKELLDIKNLQATFNSFSKDMQTLLVKTYGLGDIVPA